MKGMTVKHNEPQVRRPLPVLEGSAGPSESSRELLIEAAWRSLPAILRDALEARWHARTAEVLREGAIPGGETTRTDFDRVHLCPCACDRVVPAGQLMCDEHASALRPAEADSLRIFWGREGFHEVVERILRRREAEDIEGRVYALDTYRVGEGGGRRAGACCAFCERALATEVWAVHTSRGEAHDSCLREYNQRRTKAMKRGMRSASTHAEAEALTALRAYLDRQGGLAWRITLLDHAPSPTHDRRAFVLSSLGAGDAARLAEIVHAHPGPWTSSGSFVYDARHAVVCGVTYAGPRGPLLTRALAALSGASLVEPGAADLETTLRPVQEGASRLEEAPPSNATVATTDAQRAYFILGEGKDGGFRCGVVQEGQFSWRELEPHEFPEGTWGPTRAHAEEAARLANARQGIDEMTAAVWIGRALGMT